MREKFINSALEMLYDYAIEADVFVEKMTMTKEEAAEDLGIECEEEIFSCIRVEGENDSYEIIEYIFFETEESIFCYCKDKEILELSQLEAESMIDDFIERYDIDYDADEEFFEE